MHTPDQQYIVHYGFLMCLSASAYSNMQQLTCVPFHVHALAWTFYVCNVQFGSVTIVVLFLILICFVILPLLTLNSSRRMRRKNVSHQDMQSHFSAILFSEPKIFSSIIVSHTKIGTHAHSERESEHSKNWNISMVGGHQVNFSFAPQKQMLMNLAITQNSI